MIEKTVILRCAPARAFQLFTELAGEWWPEDRRHTKDRASAIVLDPITRGGRFYERAADGTEIELGKVRVWEPPTRLLLDWYPGTGPTLPTEVEVRFDAVIEGTRVTVLHREGASGALYSQRAPAYERSWTLVFAAWESAAHA
ncbi:hypothetical protein BH09MYX1_BH09MYX1_13910 [soil metagenome]